MEENSQNQEREMRYKRARKEMEDRYMNQSKAIHTWKILSFIFIVLFGLSFSTQLYLVRRTSIIPYIVQVDEHGVTKNIGSMNEIDYNPSENEKLYFLNQFIIRCRNIPRDSVNYTKNYQMNSYFLTEKLNNKYNEMLKEFGVTDKLANKVVVDVTIVSSQPVSGQPNNYQIRWDEKEVDNLGNLLSTKRMSGMFMVKHEKPTTIKQVENNPLGIKIVDFTITTEM